MSTSKPYLADSYLRLGRVWVLPPIFAYLFAIPGLGPGALFFPIVIAEAPLGVISYFDEVDIDGRKHRTEVAILHWVFWGLLVTGFAGRFKFPLWLLRSIWWILVIMLIMSVTGCVREFGGALRNKSNWH